MLTTGVLTTDDLDEIGRSYQDQPLSVATDLVDAVDRGLVASQTDTGYALMLAAEISKLGQDLQAAEVTAGRAIEAYRAQGDPDTYPRAFRAELLLLLGREDEAMAELTALRPLMSEDPDAAVDVMKALEDGGHAETAQLWLTEALVAALHRHKILEPQGSRACQQVTAMVFVLCQERHRLRRRLGFPLDEHDEIAEHLREAVDALGVDEPDFEAATLLFWPQHEFDRLLQRWPALAEDLGTTWDEHRTMVQQTLTTWSESGSPRLGLLAGSVDDLATYCNRHTGDPTDPQFRQVYIEHLSEYGEETAWPPGRNDPCWCGSVLKYKKCCLPRARSRT